MTLGSIDPETLSSTRGLPLVLGLVVFLGGCDGDARASAVASGEPASGPAGAPAEWTRPDGEGGIHYSPLDDITPANVGALEVAWIYRTGDVSDGTEGRAGSAFQATPVMVEGTLYTSTPFSRVVALDAETGEERWTFDPGLDITATPYNKMVTSRGVSAWVDSAASPGDACRLRIFLAAFDGRLFALDGETGERCQDFGEAGELDLAEGVARAQGEQRGYYKQTAPPAVVHDLVVVGSSIVDGMRADAPSGIVRAFDARTGERVWGWEPLEGVEGVLPDGTRIPAGAANAWATLTPDPEHDLIFVPTGSASPDVWGGYRPGDNLYANSLVALRASTGEVVWHFQAVRHDLWDYDLPVPAALVELDRDGASVPAVVLATKMGFLFFFHRLTGEPLFPIEDRPVPQSPIGDEVTAATQPFPVLPEPLHPMGLTPSDAWGLTPWDRRACRRRIEAMPSEMYAPPGEVGSISYPGPLGGMEWGGVGFDPERGLLVVNTNRLAMVGSLLSGSQLDDELIEAGGDFSVVEQRPTPWGAYRAPLLSPISLPCTPPPWGMLHAVDVQTGERVWEGPMGRMTDVAKVPTPRAWGSLNLGGPLVTGGLAFIAGTMDRRIRAYDLETGERVWEAELPASAQSTPMTYRARAGGRQFLVVNAGGHFALRTALGDFVVAFALPEETNQRVSDPTEEVP